MITKEFLLVHELYQETYDKPKSLIKTNNGFACPTIGLITLPLKVGPKMLDVSFSILITLDQLYVNLSYPWLYSMEVFLSFMHKCLKFPFENEIFIMDHSGFNIVSSHEKFSLELFFLEPMERINPFEDFFCISYQNFKVECIEKLSLQNMPTTKLIILDKTMIEPRHIPNNQDQCKICPLPTSYKIPRDNQNNFEIPPKIKQVCKVKEKEDSFLPLRKKRHIWLINPLLHKCNLKKIKREI